MNTFLITGFMLMARLTMVCLWKKYILAIGKNIYLEFYWEIPPDDLHYKHMIGELVNIWILWFTNSKRKNGQLNTFLMSEILYLIVLYIFSCYNITFSPLDYHKRVHVFLILYHSCYSLCFRHFISYSLYFEPFIPYSLYLSNLFLIP